MNNYRSVLIIVIMSSVTIALRILPFLIFTGRKETPVLVAYLGKVLPPAVMSMLVIYCLKDTTFSSLSGFLPQLIAGLTVVLSYLWKRNSLISIILGTIVFMVMIK